MQTKKEYKTALITGGAGFIGSHLVEHFLKNTNWNLIILDRLDTSGNLNRLADIDIWDKRKSRVKFLWHDLKSPINDFIFNQIKDVNYIFHLAAGTHVDRSIVDPMSFVMDNVVGTTNLLMSAQAMENLEKLFYFSTDEVFGSAQKGWDFSEWDRYNSGNPYSASKAGGEEMCLAFHNTYKVPVVITHCMNVFGERQHPEKFVPMTIKKILSGEKVFIHSDPTKTKAGSRFWIHARNVAEAILFLVDRADEGEKYNIVGEKEIDNLEMAKSIAKIIGKSLEYEMVDFHSSRPGHDLRYALNGEKMFGMGWEFPKSFEESLEKTVKWTLENQEWL